MATADYTSESESDSSSIGSALPEDLDDLVDHIIDTGIQPYQYEPLVSRPIMFYRSRIIDC